MSNDNPDHPNFTSERLRQTLEIILERCKKDGGPFAYCLIGTAAARLVGIPVAAGDIDLLVRERAHVDTFARALSEFACLRPPSWLEEARQYIAAFSVDGIQVEASTVEWPTQSPYLEALGEGPWRFNSDIAAGKVRIRTIAPELRLATELRRNRLSQIDAIVGWLAERGYDRELLDNAMTAQGIDETRQAAVRASLAVERAGE